MKKKSNEQASPSASIRYPVATYDGASVERRSDLVTTEEPLEIRVVAEIEGRQTPRSIAVTMRTPGDDFELATGFLVSEGVASKASDIWRITYCDSLDSGDEQNIVEVYLRPTVSFDLDLLTRNVITSSSCGICGRASIEAVESVCPTRPEGRIRLHRRVLVALPDTLASRQPVFAKTGGLHAAALFDERGNLVLQREDVGRHNAVDKLVGSLLGSGKLPAGDRALLVSGRVSFELVQKALVAGIPFLAAVGAPSSLAIELAENYGMTLVGFLRHGRFNVYSGEERIVASES